MSLDEWNRRYDTRDDIDDRPAELLVDAVANVAPGRALDLACGAGRNAVWLAHAGWDVVAIDGSSEAIRLVHEHQMQIDARVLDLETGAPLPFDADTFDLALILYYLHRPLFAEVKRVVRPGGLIVTAARTRGSFAAAPGELTAFFGGWDIVHARDAEIAELVARKPLTPTSARAQRF